MNLLIDIIKQIKLLPILITDRELDVALLVAIGLSKEMIADKLFISGHTVRTHKKNLYLKIDCHNQFDILNYVIREKWMTMEKILELRKIMVPKQAPKPKK